jgi:hypothetical protein
MLRIRRLTQLLIALCASAFVSAWISFAFYRVLSMTALPLAGIDIANDIGNVDDIATLKEVTIALYSVASELRDSGALLAKWGLGFVLVWSIILGTLSLVTYREVCKTSLVPTHPEIENFIDRALAGKLELWKVFWGGYVALSLLLFFISGSVLKFLTQVGSATNSLFLLNAIAGPIALSVPITIYLLSALLVWKSAANTFSIAWHYLAKAVVIVVTIVPLIRSVIATNAFLR